MDEEISLARMADIPVTRLAGIVSTRGSAFSHAAILARSLGIPAVMGIGDLPIGHLDGTPAAIDGYRGRVFINPSPDVLQNFEHIIRHEERLSADLRRLRDQPAETPDGTRVRSMQTWPCCPTSPPPLTAARKGSASTGPSSAS